MRFTARRLITGLTAIAAASFTASTCSLAAPPAQAATTHPSAPAQLAAVQAAAVKQATQAAQTGQAASPTSSASTTAATPTAPGASTALVPLPGLPTNACNNASLPADYGTNFPTPSDPNGFGFANQTAIGWTGNYYAPFEYLSGSYFARGVPDTYKQGSTSYCGQMYSFGAYTYGLASGTAPAAASVHWSMADGYLPAMITSFTRDDVAITITDFADQQTIGGNPVEVVYTRISVTNHGTATVTVPPGASGSGLVQLDTAANDVAPGQTVNHDFVASVDTFGSGQALPTLTAATSGSPSNVSTYAQAYAHMTQYWQKQVAVAPTLSLPNVSLANTNNLADPGTAIDNAYKAAYVYTRIVQTAESEFSGANNYDWLLNHDVPGILDNRFELGDFSGAQNLLLTARISEASNFNEHGANWYWDGPWRTPLAWAQYLETTNDTSFVSQYFHDDASGPSQWGPSLYTLMHTDYLAQLSATTGYLKRSNDNDSEGTWLFDDETALAGLSAYKYIANRIGNTAEAQWADGAYTSLLNATNAGLATNEQATNSNFLPCEVNIPVTGDRCNTANDANWAGSNLWGQNVWDIFLQGGTLNGTLGDASQTDNLYETGFARLAGTGVPYPSFGAYSGYSVALNTAYAAGSLYGTQYRDLPITSYAWQIATTTGGPNAWWEANGSAPDPANPWAGSHAAPQFGAVPYVWPMAGQTQTLLQSLIATGLVSSTAKNGADNYQTALYVGRGVPDAWLANGQNISVGNITSAYNEANGKRSTYGLKIGTHQVLGQKIVTVSLSGQLPGNDIQVQLPAFADEGVAGVAGGRYDATTHTVTMTPGLRTVAVVLGHSAKPTASVSVASTVPGTHSQPALTDGTQTTATATITNPGEVAISNVKATLQVPTGWTATVDGSGNPSLGTLKAGQSKTVTWAIAPPATASGGAGIVVDATYTAPENASGTVSGEQWVTTQKPLPLPAGSIDSALTATASASSTSPWTTVSAVNNGIYPIQSSDDNDLTPYWGDWPATGQQWVELDWNSPITTTGSQVYFADDGGGLALPASWQVQYWNGTDWVAVSNPSSYLAADNVFNDVTYDSVTTTKLRVLMQSGAASLGMIQWIVDSPSS
ncbi:MAG TPA: NEW3 domain-containing protein [Streptosporangiaceae bacterium]|nr:NEW3 domain-containing protein [Streptosporangiaceae bacterium]